MFFDEATSALDTATELEIVEAIDNLTKNEITSVIIAHRITTLKNCDKIFQMEDGKLIREYTYEELIKSELDVTFDEGKN